MFPNCIHSLIKNASPKFCGSDRTFKFLQKIRSADHQEVIFNQKQYEVIVLVLLSFRLRFEQGFYKPI